MWWGPGGLASLLVLEEEKKRYFRCNESEQSQGDGLSWDL